MEFPTRKILEDDIFLFLSLSGKISPESEVLGGFLAGESERVWIKGEEDLSSFDYLQF